MVYYVTYIESIEFSRYNKNNAPSITVGTIQVEKTENVKIKLYQLLEDKFIISYVENQEQLNYFYDINDINRITIFSFYDSDKFVWQFYSNIIECEEFYKFANQYNYLKV